MNEKHVLAAHQMVLTLPADITWSVITHQLNWTHMSHTDAFTLPSQKLVPLCCLWHISDN